MTKCSSVSHNVCSDNKFRAYIRQYFNSYFEYFSDSAVRFGFTRMFRKSLVILFDINPCFSSHRREDGKTILRLELVSNDGRVNFGFVQATFDGLSVFVDFDGIK